MEQKMEINLPTTNLPSKFLEYLKSFKPSELRRRKELSNNIEQLDISIPSESHCDAEISLFILRLIRILRLRSTWRIKVVLQEVVRHITWNIIDDGTRDIKVVVVKMKKKIKVTISCGSKSNNYYPTPLPQSKLDLEIRNRHVWHMNNLTNKLFFDRGYRLVMYFPTY